MKLALSSGGDPCDRFVERRIGKVDLRARVDLVVDVSNVASVDNVLFAVDLPKKSEKNVENDKWSSVADMREVINRRPADIHPHGIGIDWREDLLRPGQRIEELQIGRHRDFHRQTQAGPTGRSLL